MFAKKRIYLNRKLSVVSVDDDAVRQDLTDSFVGKHYCMIGVVRGFDLHNVSAASLGPMKGAKSLVSVDVTFDILTIPPGFIMANVEVISIKQDSNNTTYLISGQLYDVDGALVNSQIMISGKPLPIIGLITTMNKSVESLNRYKYLVVGSRTNIVCLTNILAEGKQLPISFNADVIDHVLPKCFVYNNSIDVKSIIDLAIKTKIDYPLFEKHKFTQSLKETDLVEGQQYIMSVYGLSSGTTDDSIDYITSANTKPNNSSINHEIGLDTLSGYLYHTMYNWVCAYQSSKHRE